LPAYFFHGVDSAGQSVTGEVQAESREDALRQVGDRGLTPLDVSTVGDRAGVASGPIGGRQRIAVAEQLSLLTEMATLLGGGVPVSEVLSSLAEAHPGGALGSSLDRLNRDVKSGLPLSDALRKSALQFPPYVEALCKAGEASGNLAQALHDAAKQMEYERKVSQELRSALLYPAVLVSAGAIAVLIIFVAVVPRFAALLKGSRAEIPELSRWVIEAGIFAQQHLLGLSLGAAGATLVLAGLFATPGVRAAVREVMLRVPVIGHWLTKVEVGRWATVLGSLLSNRVPIIDSMRLSAAAVASRGMRQDLDGAAMGLQRGLPLADLLREYRWFPASKLNLIRVGERSGELARMLGILGSMETEAARVTQARVLALVEPAAILIIGGVIAVIVIAVMMAITGLNASVV
jgi:general secretion pathway protein F